jgi:hypothetical protein
MKLLFRIEVGKLIQTLLISDTVGYLIGKVLNHFLGCLPSSPQV